MLTDKQLRQYEPDDLLIMVIEEASEVLQAACKAKRFGFNGSHPDRPGELNILELCREAEQMGATVKILGAKFGVNHGDLTRDRAALEPDPQ